MGLAPDGPDQLWAAALGISSVGSYAVLISKFGIAGPARRVRVMEEPVQRSVREQLGPAARNPLPVERARSGAVESTATTLPQVIQEMLLATRSEREGRAIDHDQAGSMEEKKKEGYF